MYKRQVCCLPQGKACLPNTISWRVGGGFLLLPARGPAWMGFVGRLLQDVSWASGKLLGWGTKRTCLYVSYLPPNAREGFLRVISTGVHTHCHIGRKKKVHSPETGACAKAAYRLSINLRAVAMADSRSLPPVAPSSNLAPSIASVPI